MDDLYFIFGPAAVLIGLLYAFLGLRLYKPVLMASGAMTVTAVLITPLYGFIFNDSNSILLGLLLFALIIPFSIFVGKY